MSSTEELVMDKKQVKWLIIDVLLWLVIVMTTMGVIHFFSYQEAIYTSTQVEVDGGLLAITTEVKKNVEDFQRDAEILAWQLDKSDKGALMSQWINHHNGVVELLYYNQQKQLEYHVSSTNASNIISDESLEGLLFYERWISDLITPNTIDVVYKSENAYLRFAIQVDTFLSSIDVDEETKYALINSLGSPLVIGGYYNNNADDIFFETRFYAEDDMAFFGQRLTVRVIGDSYQYIAKLRVFVVQYLAILMLSVLLGSVIMWRVAKSFHIITVKEEE